MNLRWLWRAALWARNPPSKKRVYLVLTVLGMCTALLAYEHFVGWPDWATTNGMARKGLRP